METSRIIRVGTRNRIQSTGAVSQEHVLVYIYNTQSNTNDMILVSASKSIWLLCGRSKWMWFQCGGSELTWFQCRGQNWLGFVRGSKITRFRVWIAISLVFVSGGMQNCHVFRVGMETDLTSVLGSKLTWSQCWGSNLAWFQCRDELIWLLCRW